MKYLIEEPNEFEDLAVWIEYRQTLSSLDQDDIEVQAAVHRADSMIAKSQIK